MEMIFSDDVRRRISAAIPEATRVRRSLHRDPEIKFEEGQTMAFIRDYLAGGLIELSDPLLGTDTVGLLRGRRPGPTILLRADIDALPIEEETGREWRSARKGTSHACGHDGHMAMLLIAAKILEDSIDELAGNVRFVFQPAEEEIGGGKALVAKGLLDLEPKPDVAFALHGWSGLPLGKVSGAAGATMAAADSFIIAIRGRGGHGGQPQNTADPIVTAAQAINSLQTIVSRLMDPQEPAVVSVCKVAAGNARNVIPAEATLEGTVRYFNPALKSFVRNKMDSILKGVCEACGCSHTLEYIEGYIPLVNNERAVGIAHRLVTGALGENAWSCDHVPSMATEDFAYYLDKVPGCLLRVGLGEDWPRLHNPAFDFNDAALETGVTMLVALALGYSKASAADPATVVFPS